MSRLIETIKIFDRKIWNLKYHNERMNRSRKELFGSTDSLDLAELIKIPAALSHNLSKCRVIYSEAIVDIEFHPHVVRPVSRLNIVYDDHLNYNYKFEDRSDIQKHLCNAGNSEILIVKNGLLTDTSISNIVFSDSRKYFTPAKPLLGGTKRAFLIDSGIIREDEIRLKDLPRFKYAYMINALIDLDENLRIPVENIFT